MPLVSPLVLAVLEVALRTQSALLVVTRPLAVLLRVLAMVALVLVGARAAPALSALAMALAAAGLGRGVETAAAWTPVERRTALAAMPAVAGRFHCGPYSRAGWRCTEPRGEDRLGATVCGDNEAAFKSALDQPPRCGPAPQA